MNFLDPLENDEICDIEEDHFTKNKRGRISEDYVLRRRSTLRFFEPEQFTGRIIKFNVILNIIYFFCNIKYYLFFL